MTLAALIAAMVEMAGDDCHAPCKARAAALAPVLLAEAGDMPVRLLAAVSWIESSYRPDAVNPRTGCLGVMGINPSPTADAAVYCRDLDVRTVRGNVACGARLIGKWLRKCGTVEGALSRFRGHRCGPSEYATMVLARTP